MEVIQFPKVNVRRRHRRDASAGARAAISTIVSAFSPAVRATSVERTAPHHSEGMLSRRRHFETCEREAPMSDIAASIEGQRSITSANDLGISSVIESVIGQNGLFDKAIVAHDHGAAAGETASMTKGSSASDDKKAFIQRVREARSARYDTQEDMAELLGIEQGTYKHYEVRTPLPYALIPRFVLSTGVDYAWLFTGVGRPPVHILPPKPPQPVRPRGRRSKKKVA